MLIFNPNEVQAMDSITKLVDTCLNSACEFYSVLGLSLSSCNLILTVVWSWVGQVKQGCFLLS